MMGSAIFNFTLPSEILLPEEIVGITGAYRKADQIEWLNCNGWVFHRNRAGEPIVGRMYARLRMAGVNPPAMIQIQEFNTPDFSKVR